MVDKRPRLLDLFCGAGIGADGYIAAGFDVTGVDINPQPNYPGEFYKSDTTSLLSWFPWFREFDVIHASPPCQLFTRAQHLRDAQGSTSKESIDLLTPTLAILREIEDIPWVVENVAGAPGMENAVMLCGSSFGLGVRRHRYFLSNRPLVGKPCDHKGQGRPWGVYHVPNDNIPAGGRTARDLAQRQGSHGCLTRPAMYLGRAQRGNPAGLHEVDRGPVDGDVEGGGMTRPVFVGPVELAHAWQVECLAHAWRYEGTEDGCRVALSGHRSVWHRKREA